MTGVPMLTRPLASTSIADARINVLIAPGADVTAASGTWTFTDVTTDVMFKNDVSISIGRADEQSEAQTASLKLTLLNDAGNYTPRRRQGSFWPNMRLGFPVKVTVWSTTTGDVELFTGYADELVPSWNVSMNVPTVTLAAKGTIQRLQQGNQSIISSLSAAALDTSFASTVGAYWPVTDAARSLTIASGLSAGAPMSFSGGSMDFASYTDFDGTEPIAKFGAGANIAGTVNGPGNTTGSVIFRCLLFAATALTDNRAMIQFITTGTIKYWYIRYNTGGAMRVTGSDSSGTEVYNSGPVAFGVDSSKFQLGLELVQSGANVAVFLYTVHQDADGSVHRSSFTDSVLAQTLGRCNSVSLGGNGTMTDWAVGQIAIGSNSNWIPSLSKDLFTGYEQEFADERIQRLCDEAGVPVTITGTSSIRMGPQSNGTLVDALKECEAADHGLLFDGVGFGLGYVCRSARENATVALALNIASGHLMPPFEPVENTRLVRNDVTVSRKEGSSARAVQASGQPYAPDTAGRFDTSVTVNVSSDDNLSNHAGWLLALGTIDQDRYPNLSLDLAASPSIALDWLTKGKLGARATVTGLPATGGADPDLFVEGIDTTIGPQTWEVSVNCSPATPYDVGVLDNAGGTYAADHVVLDTAASTVNTSALAGATSLSVASSGVLWTTTASHLPLWLSVDGWKVQVTAISGASSPQTFTVSALPAAISAGKPVKLWAPNLLAL